MRLRNLSAAATAAITILALSPGAASAARHESAAGCRIGINVAPHLIEAGEATVVFGRLLCPGRPGRAAAYRAVHVQTHAVASLERIGRYVSTDSRGFYEFVLSGIEYNSTLYVTAVGARSATVHVGVLAHVTMQGPPEGSQLLTGFPHRVTFSGTVSPRDVGATVVLQRQNAAGGNEWRRIQVGFVGFGGVYSITHTFVVPGDANIRVLVRSQGRNMPTPSDVRTYEISQAQNSLLTIESSANPITFGQQITISGTVTGAAPNTAVTLLSHTAGQEFAPVAEVKANSSGQYTMPIQAPASNTLYEVRAAGKTSAVLFEGVRNLLTAQVSAATITAGQSLTFSGAVAPDHVGHVIYLERRDRVGTEFHVVQVAYVGPGSTYTIVHTVYDPGLKVFRVKIPGGPDNEGVASAPFTVNVNPAPAAALRPESPGNSSLPAEGES